MVVTVLKNCFVAEDFFYQIALSVLLVSFVILMEINRRQEHFFENLAKGRSYSPTHQSIFDLNDQPLK